MKPQKRYSNLLQDDTSFHRLFHESLVLTMASSHCARPQVPSLAG